MHNQIFNSIRPLIGILLPLCLTVTACSSQQVVKFSVLQESIQCRTQQPNIVAISSQQEIIKLSKLLRPFKGSDNNSKSLFQLFMEHAEQEQLFLVSQGQKPSSGYSFLVSSNEGILMDKTLTLPITFTSPNKNSMQAQMITSPCLVLGVDSKVDFDRLVIDSLSLNISK